LTKKKFPTFLSEENTITIEEDISVGRFYSATIKKGFDL